MSVPFLANRLRHDNHLLTPIAATTEKMSNNLTIAQRLYGGGTRASWCAQGVGHSQRINFPANEGIGSRLCWLLEVLVLPGYRRQAGDAKRRGKEVCLPSAKSGKQQFVPNLQKEKQTLLFPQAFQMGLSRPDCWLKVSSKAARLPW